MGDKVWVQDSKYDAGFAPVFAPRWKGPYIVKERLDKNAYRPRTDPLVSGKRSTALQYPINCMRLRKVTEQELKVIEEKAREVAVEKAEEAAWPVSFVMTV